jgi:hypothetical protein
MREKERIPGLLDEDFVSVYPTLAVRAGINKAAILQKLHYLVRITENARNEANFIEGRWWVYNTYADWQKHYFPWLAISTLKLLFLSLEKEGIVLVWTPPDNDQKKYYTIDYARFSEWMAATPSKNYTGQTRTKNRRDPDKNSTGPVQKLAGRASKNDPTPVQKLAGSSIYKDSENTQKRLSETTQTTPATSAPDLTAPTGDGADDDCKFILPEIQKLGLTPKAQNELLALGAQKALATAFAAQKSNIHNPAGFAMSLLANGGPSALDLEQARIALETRCLDRETADAQARQIEFEDMNRRTLEEVARKAQQQESPHDSTPLPPDGLDTPIGSSSEKYQMTIKDYWLAALGSLSLQLNKSTYDCYVKGTKALKYADGVLTVQAVHPMAHEMLIRHEWLTSAVSKAAGTPIQVEVVLAGEGVGG